MLRWRLLLGTLIIAALVGLGWLDYHTNAAGLWLLPVAAVATILATREILDLAALAQLRPFRPMVYVGNLLLLTSSWIVIWLECTNRGLPLNWYTDGPAHLWSILATLPALGMAVLLIFLAEMDRYEKPGGNLANLAAGVFALIYVGLMMTFAVQLRLVWGIGALASWIVVVKMGDTGAYVVGRLIGRHKMSPRISPGKTVEGAVGALVFSCIGAWATFGWLIPYLDSGTLDSPLSWSWIVSTLSWRWVAYGVLVGVAGMIGDLAESLLKRDVGVKDSSTWLPGFGGALDIVDSLLLSAPVAWSCWIFGIVGQ
jgi:phosphatidate cytidylyltransferase